MTEVKDRAIVLRITQAQDADVIVSLLRSTGERLTAFAKAGLKSKKRFGGGLQPLLHVQFRATKKTDRELHFLEEIVVKSEFRGLRQKLERLVAASYVAELVEQCTHEGLEHKEIYNLLGGALKTLEQAEMVTPILRQFELKLLFTLGWLPELNTIQIDRRTKVVLIQMLQTPLTSKQNWPVDMKVVEDFTSDLLRTHWQTKKLRSEKFLNGVREFIRTQ